MTTPGQSLPQNGMPADIDNLWRRIVALEAALAGGLVGSGTVTSVAVTTANGVSGTVTNPTTAAAISLALGAITPTSVAASGTVTGSNLSGTNTGDQTVTLTGDVTGSGTGSFAATIGANKVTLAKLAASVGSSVLLGSQTGGGNYAEITLGTNLSMTGGVLNASGGGGVAWGAISGTLSSQTDLNTALSGKTSTSIVPNTAPSAGQILVGNAGGTAYAPVSMSGDATLSSAGALTVAAAAIGLSKMANLAANSIIGNNTGLAATPIALTAAQVKTLLAIANTDVSGLGTMSTQNASAVAITGGSVNGTSFKNYTETVYAGGNTGTAQTLALTNGNVQTWTLTGNCTFTMPTATAGASFRVLLSQDATGGRTATFTSVKWPGGTAPTITTTASKTDRLAFEADGTSWYGSVIGQNY